MAQSPTMALPKRLPLVIDPANRDHTTAKDSRLVNCYVELQQVNGETETWIYKRPGTDEHSRPPAANATGRGVFNWRGDIYSIFGSTLYRNGVAVVGSVNTSGGIYRFDQVLGATPRMVFGDGVEAYYYDTSGGLVNITDADFPSAFRKGWAYLDGTLYVLLANAHIQGSGINDPSSWDPLNDILAQIEPDQGVALNKQLVYVIALKEWSLEAFYDAGNATGSPLGFVQGAKVNYGCGTQDSVQQINGALFFISTSKSAGVQVGKLDQLKFDIISTPAIEKLLQEADLTAVYSFQLALDGHSHYVFTLKTDNLTLAYDIDQNRWWQWTDADGNYCKIVSSTYDETGIAILQHESNGRLYTASSDYVDDDGSLFACDIYTPNFDAGVQSRGKYLPSMTFVADRIPGCVLEVRTNDADYTVGKWSNPRLVDLGQKTPILTDNGSFNRRAYWFRHKRPTKMRLKAIELQMDLCALPVSGG